jgi:7-cyano-7-deazaguanine synthase
MSKVKDAIILLSGGLDSATVASIAIEKNYRLHAISFNYKQRHKIELESAKKLVKYLKIKSHYIIDIDPVIFANSALTSDITIPENLDPNRNEIPVTYVPARNCLFLAYALAMAESKKSYDIFIGANAVDYSGYPDCRPEFIKSFNNMANLATKLYLQDKVTIHAPLLHLTKSEIIKLGLKLNTPYNLTHSCYNPDPNGKACQKCDSCLIRKEAFANININDPILACI